MMSFDRKGSSHIRLPSFNELTSNFASNLTLQATPSSNSNKEESIKEDIETKSNSSASSTTTVEASSPKRNTTNPLEFKFVSETNATPQYSHQASSQPVTPTFRPQMPYQAIPYQQYEYHHIQAPQPPTVNVQHFMQLPPPPPPPPPTGEHSHPPPPPHFQHDAQMSNYRFPQQPQQSQQQAHYQEQFQPPQPPNLQHNQTHSQTSLPHSFNDSRRLSMQFPPYPSRHKKNDSYDSQTSLSTLADIASSTREDNYTSLLKDLESMLITFENLNQIINEVNNDFHNNLEYSKRSTLQVGNSDNDVNLTLNYEYPNQTKTLKLRFFKQFLDNIPIAQLNEAIGISNDLNKFFQSWLVQREKEDIFESQEQIQIEQSIQKSIDEEVVEKLRKQRKSINNQHKKTLSFTSSKKTHLRQPSSDISKVRKKQEFHHHGGGHQRRQSKITGPVPDEFVKLDVSKKQRKQSKSGIEQIMKPFNSTTTTTTTTKTGTLNVSITSLDSEMKCKQCGSDDTPEWRRGPYGTRSLCNACGLFFGKLTKKFGIDEATRIMMERRDKGTGDDRRIPTEI